MAIKRGPDGVPVDMPSVIAPIEPETRASGIGSNTANDGPTVTTPSNATPVNTIPSSSSPSRPANSGLIFDEPSTTPANRQQSTTPSESVDIRENAEISEHDDIDALPTVVGGTEDLVRRQSVRLKPPRSHHILCLILCKTPSLVG